MGLTRWIEDTWLDPERRARALQFLWLASLGMLALGYALIARHYWGRLPWP